MTLSLFQKITLGLAGITALVIGLCILAVPHQFYASYGISLADDASLLSELRAPGAGLAVLGGLMLWGMVKRTMRQVALAAALTVYIAFPAGRLVGVLVDGMPSGSILGALVFEVGIAALCLLAFRRGSRPPAPQGNSSHAPAA
ncbi:DUF4345 domain-containing protein [Mameliella sp. AT18]|uniref:DUF4345 domain-containing protein n=1 Tax=Mameliella sp. AT18 TaxID=3028385 RepID=UPI0008411CA3|nr:DUF4345 domain-containing protein [Mameliella sp. AT18]MDD9731638.1 DUF4345 domain-containing protein [Mameliella sp. AT18]ODM46402.1 hypothetical protein A9320_07115 [Ruegeria sp. PBVC088]